MALFTAGNPNIGGITGSVITLLVALRDTLTDIAALQAWLAAQSQADLEGLGFTASDLSMLLSAMADANAIGQIYNTGQAPSTYPQVVAPYPYAASQRLVIGPR